jgi:hypothetical protein
MPPALPRSTAAPSPGAVRGHPTPNREVFMFRRSHAIRLAALAGVLLATACSEAIEPVEVDPLFNAQSNGRGHGSQDLARWFAQASPEVMSLPLTVFADHDEVNGRLVFAIENASAARGVQTALARLGIPADAYVIQLSEPIFFASDNLRSEHRPTVGGLQIHFSSYLCTLGFNVDHAGGRSFITNSHCTDQQGTTGSTVYHQPVRTTGASPIAHEAHDPAYTKLTGCSRGKVCRYSDAARALYAADASSERGAIAKTTGENNGSLAVAGGFTITAQNNTATSFSGTVHKVGRTTGWSSGNVTNTCATVNVSGSSIQLLCQTLVQRSGSVIVQGGDSGSPVFRPTSGDNVELVGILWGGSSGGDMFVFSPLKNIQDELGGVTATFDGSGGGSGGGGGGGGGEEPAPCVSKGNGNNCK